MMLAQISALVLFPLRNHKYMRIVLKVMSSFYASESEADVGLPIEVGLS